MKRKSPKYLRTTKKDLRLRFIQLMVQGLVLAAALSLLHSNLTVGWFSSNKEVTAQNMAVAVDAIDLKASFHIYTHDPVAPNTVVDQPVNGAIDLTCNPVDLIFKQNNKYNKTLIRMELTGTDLLEGNRITVDLIRNQSGGVTTSQLPKTASALFRFTGISGKSLETTNTDALARFNAVVNALNGVDAFTGILPPNTPTGDSAPTIGSSSVFAVKPGEQDNYQISEQISIQIPYRKSDLYDLSNGSKKLVVYLMVSYDFTLTNHHHNTTIGTITPNGGAIQFENDLDRMVISVTKS